MRYIRERQNKLKKMLDKDKVHSIDEFSSFLEEFYYLCEEAVDECAVVPFESDLDRVLQQSAPLMSSLIDKDGNLKNNGLYHINVSLGSFYFDSAYHQSKSAAEQVLRNSIRLNRIKRGFYQVKRDVKALMDFQIREDKDTGLILLGSAKVYVPHKQGVFAAQLKACRVDHSHGFHAKIISTRPYASIEDAILNMAEPRFLETTVILPYMRNIPVNETIIPVLEEKYLEEYKKQ